MAELKNSLPKGSFRFSGRLQHTDHLIQHKTILPLTKDLKDQYRGYSQVRRPPTPKEEDPPKSGLERTATIYFPPHGSTLDRHDRQVIKQLTHFWRLLIEEVTFDPPRWKDIHIDVEITGHHDERPSPKNKDYAKERALNTQWLILWHLDPHMRIDPTSKQSALHPQVKVHTSVDTKYTKEENRSSKSKMKLGEDRKAEIFSQVWVKPQGNLYLHRDVPYNFGPIFHPDKSNRAFHDGHGPFPGGSYPKEKWALNRRQVATETREKIKKVVEKEQEKIRDRYAPNLVEFHSLFIKVNDPDWEKNEEKEHHYNVEYNIGKNKVMVRYDAYDQFLRGIARAEGKYNVRARN